MPRQTIVCVFDREEDLLAATSAARARGIAIADAYTPYAVHGLDRAMGLAPSRLPYACFGLGLAGALSILVLQYWASARSWPINVGGRPWNSLPAFVPATFEMMVAFAGLGTVILFLAIAGLRPWRRAVLPAARVTNDRFALVLRPGAAADDRAAIETMMTRFRPAAIELREEA